MRAPFSGLAGAEFFAAGHQARHFGFGDGQFLAAKFGQRNILDDVILRHLPLSLILLLRPQ